MAVTSSGDAEAAAASSSGDAASGQTSGPAQPDGVLAEVSRVAAAARETCASFLELVSLEARRAGITLVWMVAAGIAAALLAVTGWLGVVVALAMWIVSLGFPPIGAVLAIALISAGAAAGLVYWCVAASRALLFPATRRQLAGGSPNRAPAS